MSEPDAAAAPAEAAIPLRPHMEDAGAARLEALLRTAKAYMEFGAGGSTMLAGELGVPLIISTESDREYCRRLRRQFCPRYLHSLLVSLHADLGPTQDWGYPAKDLRARQWPRYPTTAWRFARRCRRQPDLVLIDGRFRSACLLVSLSCAAAGTPILFDDYVGRPYAATVERFARPLAFHGRMAEFAAPGRGEIDPGALALALSQAFMDPA